jgi:hypothetical protein
MEEKRKKEIKSMADAIEHVATAADKKLGTLSDRNTFHHGEVSADIIRKRTKADEIIATKKLEIPVCKSIPINGRIYVVSVKGDDMVTPGGLILPPTFGTKKNDQVEGVNRYFVVAWDKIGIPAEISDLLCTGIEVHPFLPQNAEEWQLPRVVDWDGNHFYDVLHYTELAGISSNRPEIVEK